MPQTNMISFNSNSLSAKVLLYDFVFFLNLYPVANVPLAIAICNDLCVHISDTASGISLIVLTITIGKMPLGGN